MRLVTLGERPDLLPALRRLTAAVWPPTMEYVHHDAVCLRHWPALVHRFAEFQPLLCDRRGRVVAGGYTIPFVWDGRRATLPRRTRLTRTSVNDAAQTAVALRARRHRPPASAAR